MKQLKEYMNNLPTINEKDKWWLIGIIEAKGSFTVGERGELQFVITQGYRNLAVLYHIKEIIGFGSVNKQGPRTFRYAVQDERGLAAIIDFLNGNIVQTKRIMGEKGLMRFIDAYNQKYGTSIIGKREAKEPTRKNGWLSGYMDGDGCFTIGYVKMMNTFYIKAIISQKENQEDIRKVTGGSMEYSQEKKKYSIVMKDLPTSEGENTEWWLAYIEEHRLRTTKWNSFLLWQYIRKVLLTKKQFTPQEVEKIKAMVQLINQDPAEQAEIYIPQEDHTPGTHKTRTRPQESKKQ